VPAGLRKGHAGQQLDLKGNTFKWARKKYAVSAVSVQKRKAGGNSGYMPVIIFRGKSGSVLPFVFLNAPGAGFAKAALAATAESRFRQDGTPTKKKSTSFESGNPKHLGLQEEAAVDFAGVLG
jgi:hypothetical protein